MQGKPASIIILSLFVVSGLASAFNVQPVKSDFTTRTIYVRADGSIDPPTAPISTVDNVTYTIMDNIAGYFPYFSSAIIIQRDNIIIDGAGHTLQGGQYTGSTGLELMGRSNVTIKNMNITAFYYGIQLYSSSNNSVRDNYITNCGFCIWLYSSSNNSVSGNDIPTNNLQGTGVWLESSSNNSVCGNNIAINWEGIQLYSSSNNSVRDNYITDCGYYGIWLEYSYNNSMNGNDIENCGVDGIFLYRSIENTVSGNNITKNGCGIALLFSSNNLIYHDNFVKNAGQVSSSGSTNIWDNGYPSGGNYWSDYSGVDLYRGSYQNETGSDGIGDSPHTIDANNTDHYPLMKLYPWAAHDIGITSVASSKKVVGQGYDASINAMISNYGNSIEAVNVTIYANQTIIGEIRNINLNGRDFAALAFTWNTFGFAEGNYTISAYASPVPGETDLTDNNQTDGRVVVAMVGDLTGGTPNPWDFVPDGKVDGKDITIVALCYGSAPGCPPPYVWNPNSDVNNDGRIDGKDIAIVALHYGQADP